MSFPPFSAGRYKPLHQIGSGGTGVMYLAQDSLLSRQVALKVSRLDDTFQKSERVAQRIEKLFLQKIQTIAQLDHSHIVPVSDFGQEQIDRSIYLYVVMPYHPAGSFADWLQKEQGNLPSSVSAVAAFLLQAAEALSYAHIHGIIHQDIKPSNFLLSTSGEQSPVLRDLLLTDFGFAPFCASLSSQGLSQSAYVRSTSPYIAPEQWDGQAVSASDQYALAIMAFSLLTGQLPFQGSLGQIIHQHYTGQPPAPSSLNPQIDPSIDKILARALAKKAEKRFPSVLAFAQEFSPFQSNQQDCSSSHAACASPCEIPTVLFKDSQIATMKAPLHLRPISTTLSVQATSQAREDHLSSQPTHPNSEMVAGGSHFSDGQADVPAGKPLGMPRAPVLLKAPLPDPRFMSAGGSTQDRPARPLPVAFPRLGFSPRVRVQKSVLRGALLVLAVLVGGVLLFQGITGFVREKPSQSGLPKSANIVVIATNSASATRSTYPTSTPRSVLSPTVNPAPTRAHPTVTPTQEHPTATPTLKPPTPRPSGLVRPAAAGAKWWVTTFANARGYFYGGTLYAATNYVFCKEWGPRVSDSAGNYNHWWLWTDMDTGGQDFVSAYYLKLWGNDVAKDNNGNIIPNCS